MSTVSRIPNQNVLAVQPGAGFHNSIYRGKYLGSSVSSAQWAAISAGTFEDLFIGDYWTIGGVNWRIAGFDYWLNTGDLNCTTHHAVIGPDSNIASGPMNATNITTGGYALSDFFTGANSNAAKAAAVSAVNNAFGAEHILSHREYFTNGATGGVVDHTALYNSTVELMNEIMVYGTCVYASTPRYEAGVSNSQLPLFQLEHGRVSSNREAWWLRDVSSSTRFAVVGNTGVAANSDAQVSRGIRPAFGIKA